MAIDGIDSGGAARECPRVIIERRPEREAAERLRTILRELIGERDIVAYLERTRPEPGNDSEHSDTD